MFMQFKFSKTTRHKANLLFTNDYISIMMRAVVRCKLANNIIVAEDLFYPDKEKINEILEEIKNDIRVQFGKIEYSDLIVYKAGTILQYLIYGKQPQNKITERCDIFCKQSEYLLMTMLIDGSIIKIRLKKINILEVMKLNKIVYQVDKFYINEIVSQIKLYDEILGIDDHINKKELWNNCCNYFRMQQRVFDLILETEVNSIIHNFGKVVQKKNRERLDAIVATLVLAKASYDAMKTLIIYSNETMVFSHRTYGYIGIIDNEIDREFEYYFKHKDDVSHDRIKLIYNTIMDKQHIIIEVPNIFDINLIKLITHQVDEGLLIQLRRFYKIRGEFVSKMMKLQDLHKILTKEYGVTYIQDKNKLIYSLNIKKTYNDDNFYNVFIFNAAEFIYNINKNFMKYLIDRSANKSYSELYSISNLKRETLDCKWSFTWDVITYKFFKNNMVPSYDNIISVKLWKDIEKDYVKLPNAGKDVFLEVGI